MQISYASERGVGDANEDYAVCGANWAVILDGATAMPGVESGCIHDVPWLVRQFAAALGVRMARESVPLADLVASAIEEVRSVHAGSCDLSNPDSPSTTVAIARVSGGVLDYLVLADSPIAVWHSNETVQVLDDDRLARLPGGRPYSRELIRSCRNAPGGFWVASTKPEAAYESVRGSMRLGPDDEIALCTDGVTRLVDFYGYSWRSLFALLQTAKPGGLIAEVRKMEQAKRLPHGKQHDDATVVHMTPTGGSLYPMEQTP